MPSTICLPTNVGLVFLDMDKVLYIRSNEVYAHLQTADEKYFVLRSLKQVEDLLDPDQFFRCHKSFIINVSKLYKFYKHENQLELTNGEKVPIARARKRDFLDFVSTRFN